MENQLADYRYERKFAIDEVSSHQIINHLKVHPALFIQAYPPRYVNNIYFDSHRMCTYHANMDGSGKRLKVRIRWYGDLLTTITHPILEFKIKHGSLGTKETVPLPSFTLSSNTAMPNFAGLFTQADIAPQFAQLLHQVRPALINRYYRHYYVSADGQFRATVDTDLGYYRVNPLRNAFLHRTIDRRTTILEIKYPQDHAHLAHRVTNPLTFRMTRNSKYIVGLESLFS